MTRNLTTGRDGTDASLLAEAEQLFFDSVQALSAIVQDLKINCDVPNAEVRKCLSDVRSFARIAFEERKRVKDELQRGQGPERPSALDLDAARIEVGRRMARLRAATRATDVSTKPE